MERNYKVFVHLSSLKNGTIVAQHDNMPHNWTYLTSWWEKDEVVTDTITLDVSGLSPGRYEVSVGIYDPDITERLHVVDRSGAPLSQRKLVLPFILDITG